MKLICGLVVVALVGCGGKESGDSLDEFTVGVVTDVLVSLNPDTLNGICDDVRSDGTAPTVAGWQADALDPLDTYTAGFMLQAACL